MRSTPDRIRHALSFEVIGLILVTPLGALAFHVPMAEIGVVTLVSATLATVWNYGYNILFDHALLRLTGRLGKSLGTRVAHAVLFEAGLLVILMPFIAWYLGVSLTTAFWMDLGFSLFYLVYAFVFNWTYDWVFPVPDQS
jgi:uncharacterized membrane protein